MRVPLRGNFLQSTLTGETQPCGAFGLPQVALIVYLAHVGSFVPADAAHIPIVDQILTRIHTHESVSQVRFY